MNERPDADTMRAKLYALLGDLPPRDRPIGSRVIEKRQMGDFEVETLLLDLNGIEPVPAYFLSPIRAGSRPLPVVLYNHAHGQDYNLGKEELIRGREGLQNPPYGQVLTAAGYRVLCIDQWVFGQRRGRTESELSKEMLWRGQVLWGMMVYDTMRAVDYIETRLDAEMGRIATMGLSMGSTMSWWSAALEPRIKVCIDMCCMTDFQALIEARGLDGHGDYYYVPGLLKHFSTSDINALIAPRPHLSLAGIYDPLTPPSGLDRIDKEVSRAYVAAGASRAWRMLRYNVGHFETAAMRAEVLAFLREWL